MKCPTVAYRCAGGSAADEKDDGVALIVDRDGDAIHE
jgi:hypothetical protein